MSAAEAAASLLANRETTRRALEREIRYCREEAARLRQDCAAFAHKALQLDREREQFERQLAGMEDV